MNTKFRQPDWICKEIQRGPLLKNTEFDGYWVARYLSIRGMNKSKLKPQNWKKLNMDDGTFILDISNLFQIEDNQEGKHNSLVQCAM